MIGIVRALGENPQLFHDFMKVRDQDGESIFTHFISTKQFDVLETRPIQQSVTTLWLGSVTTESPFMQNSTAYKTLFQQDFELENDTEKLTRRDSFSMNRTHLWSRKPGTHQFSYINFFSGV